MAGPPGHRAAALRAWGRSDAAPSACSRATLVGRKRAERCVGSATLAAVRPGGPSARARRARRALDRCRRRPVAAGDSDCRARRRRAASREFNAEIRRRAGCWTASPCCSSNLPGPQEQHPNPRWRSTRRAPARWVRQALGGISIERATRTAGGCEESPGGSTAVGACCAPRPAADRRNGSNGRELRARQLLPIPRAERELRRPDTSCCGY
jgi:hypothetical protein